MAITFGQIAKGLLIAGGTILSFTGVGAAVGVPLITAGLALPSKTSNDPIAAYPSVIAQVANGVNAGQIAQEQPEQTIITSNIMAFIKANAIWIIAAIAGVWYLIKRKK